MIDIEAIANAPAAAPPAMPATAMRVDLVATADVDTLAAEWRELLDSALDDSPFMALEFLLPAAIHAADGGPELVAVREEGDDRLVGLFPLAGAIAGAAEIWERPRHASLWRHPLQPFAAPLLAGPTERARRTVGVVLDWLAERPALAGFDAASMPAGCAAAALFVEEAEARRLPVLRRREADRTRGLHFKPRGLRGAVDRVAIATEPAALHAALETLLCLDRMASPAKAVLMRDPLLPGLLRAAVRGFGGRGRAAIALMDEADGRAGALVLRGRDRGYLWRLSGPDAADPAVEAALAVAAERRLGTPIAAASVQPLSGAGLDAMATESLAIGLRTEQSSVFGRMRMWVASGSLGFG